MQVKMNRKNKRADAGRDVRGKNMTMAGIMAALVVLMTAYICHVPLGTNGGYIHFGDSVIYLAAVLLPTPYALAAAAIGGGLSDLLTAPMWMPATIVIKMLIVLPFTNRSAKIITLRNLAATVSGYLISGIGYFLAEYILFGAFPVFFVSMGQILIQSLGSAIVFAVIGIALDKAHVKTRYFTDTLNHL